MQVLNQYVFFQGWHQLLVILGTDNWNTYTGILVSKLRKASDGICPLQFTQVLYLCTYKLPFKLKLFTADWLLFVTLDDGEWDPRAKVLHFKIWNIFIGSETQKKSYRLNMLSIGPDNQTDRYPVHPYFIPHQLLPNTMLKQQCSLAPSLPFFHIPYLLPLSPV